VLYCTVSGGVCVVCRFLFAYSVCCTVLIHVWSCSHGDAQPQQKDLHTLGLTVRGRGVNGTSSCNNSVNMSASMNTSTFTASSAPAPAQPLAMSAPQYSAEVSIPSVSHENARSTANNNSNNTGAKAAPAPAPAPARAPVPAPGVVKGMVPTAQPKPADDFINRAELPTQLASTFDYIIGQLDMISTTVALFDQRLGLMEDNLAVLNSKTRGATTLSPVRTAAASAPAATSAPKPAPTPAFQNNSTPSASVRPAVTDATAAGMAEALGLMEQLEEEAEEDYYGNGPDDDTGMDGMPDSSGEEEDYSQKFSEYDSDNDDEDVDDIEIK
jgi:hypothetical protein